MPLQGISSGKDGVVSFTDSNGIVITSRIKEFTFNQKVNAKETQALDGFNRHANFPAGYQGSFMMERTGPEMDQYIANRETSYYQGQLMPAITGLFTLNEVNGGVSQYQFIGVDFHYEDAGTYKSDDFVYQKIAFVAQQRNVLS